MSILENINNNTVVINFYLNHVFGNLHVHKFMTTYTAETIQSFDTDMHKNSCGNALCKLTVRFTNMVGQHCQAQNLLQHISQSMSVH